MKDYTEYIVEQTQKLLSIDSPTGYTKNVAAYLMKVYTELGYEPELTTKGGVFVKIADGVSEDGERCDPAAGPILIEAHVDTLGAMVSEITSAGHLNLTPLIMRKQKTAASLQEAETYIQVPSSFAMLPSM